MDYLQKLKHHFKPRKGWINDPNGLVYYKGYYHIFYQHCPNYEIPWQEPMHWGHARTKDFLSFEELPIALYPDCDYDENGCWSGTAIVKDDVLYLFYASVRTKEKIQTVSIAYSTDGINFEKYSGNPVIDSYPADGGPDFRDPAVCFVDGKYYLVMATGHAQTKKARLLLYESDDLLTWKYSSIMSEWENSMYAECPSLCAAGDKYLLAASVCPHGAKHYFSLKYGNFIDGKFVEEICAEADKGPDQYAGQIFLDGKGRNILMSWISGWRYKGFAERDVGCLSVPKEVKLVDGKVYLYPIEELWHLLRDEDECLRRTERGFVIERQGREPVVYEGEINDIKILRDGYIVEVFLNGGVENFTALL